MRYKIVDWPLYSTLEGPHLAQAIIVRCAVWSVADRYEAYLTPDALANALHLSFALVVDLRALRHKLVRWS